MPIDHPESGQSDNPADPDREPDFSNTLELLEQLCWHIFCCDLIFDVFQDDLFPAINEAASAGELPDYIADLRQDLQDAFRVATERITGEASRSDAEDAIEDIERAADTELLPFRNRGVPPQCTVTGCEDSVLDLEGGRWSTRCYAHSSTLYRIRHERVHDWLFGAIERGFTLRMMARRNVAEALVAWWRDIGSPRHLIDEAIRPEKLVLPSEMLP